MNRTLFEEHVPEEFSDDDDADEEVSKIFSNEGHSNDKNIPLSLVLKWLDDINLQNTRLKELRRDMLSPAPIPDATTPKTLVRHARTKSSAMKTPSSNNSTPTQTEVKKSILQVPSIVVTSSMLAKQDTSGESEHPEAQMPRHKRRLSNPGNFTGHESEIRIVDRIQRHSQPDTSNLYVDETAVLQRWSSSPSVLSTTKNPSSQFYCMLTTLDSRMSQGNVEVPPMFCRYECADDCVSALYRKYGTTCTTGLSLSGSILKILSCGAQFAFSSSEHALSVFEILARRGKIV